MSGFAYAGPPVIYDRVMPESNSGWNRVEINAESIELDREFQFESIAVELEETLIGLGYSQEGIPEIVRGFEKVLSVIDSELGINNLKTELKSNDLESLKTTYGNLMTVLQNNGYFVSGYDPETLIAKLIINIDGGKELLAAIDNSNLADNQKAIVKSYLVACTARAQFGLVLLKLLGVENIKPAYKFKLPAHAFLFIEVNKSDVLLVDFSLLATGSAKVGEHYQRKGEYLYLSHEYVIPDDEVENLRSQLQEDFTVSYFDNDFSQYNLRRQSLDKKSFLNLYYSPLHVLDEGGFAGAINFNFATVYYLELGQFDDAIKQYTKSLDSGLGEIRTYSYLAQACECKGNTSLAANAYYNLGVVSFNAGQSLISEDAFRNSIRLDPYQSSTYWQLSRVDLEAGRIGSAIKNGLSGFMHTVNDLLP